jgi:hypothetical protein
MNTNPWVPNQLANLRTRIERLAKTPGPVQDLAVAVAGILQHVTEGDTRVAELEKKVMLLSQSARK